MSGLNIADIFETVVATAPERSAVVVRTCDGRNEVRLTFAELDARVNQLAHALLELGVGAGDTSAAISTTATNTSRSCSRRTRCARSRST